MKKIILPILCLFLLNLVSAIDVSACGALNTANTVYNQINNIIPNDDSVPCLEVSASNITFNGAGFWIANNTFGNAILSTSTGLRNITVQNSNFTAYNLVNNFETLFFDSAINSSITNNTITGFRSIYISSGSQNSITSNRVFSYDPNGLADTTGIYLLSSDNIVFANNITTDGDGGMFGLIIEQGDRNNITLNRIFTNGTLDSNIGIELIDSADSNIIQSNTIQTNGTGFNYGMYISNSQAVRITSNIIRTYGSEADNVGILLETVTFTNITTNDIRTSGLLGNSHGISFVSTSNLNRVTSGNITTVQNETNNAINILESLNNIFNLTSILNSSGKDLNIDTTTGVAVNLTSFLDMYIEDYAITGAAGARLFINTNPFGSVRFIGAINGSGANFSQDVRILNNSLTVITNSSYNPGFNQPANITLTGLATSGFTKLLKDGRSCQSVCFNFTSLNAGTVIFNVTGWTNYSVGTGTDTTGPIVNLIAPANGSTIGTSISTATISFNATFTDDDILKNVTLFIWNSSLAIVNQTNRTVSGFSEAINISVSLVPGNYTWNYLAADISNNIAWNNSNYSFTITSDTTIPQVTIINPQNTTYTTLSIPFEVSVNEASSSALFSVNNGVTNFTMNANSSATGFSSTIHSLVNGSYTVRYFVTDQAGNLNSTVNRTFSIASSEIVLPNCGGTLNSANSLYILNISKTYTNNCFTINATNVTIDGNGLEVSGATSQVTLFVASNISGITIKDFSFANTSGSGNDKYLLNATFKFTNSTSSFINNSFTSTSPSAGSSICAAGFTCFTIFNLFSNSTWINNTFSLVGTTNINALGSFRPFTIIGDNINVDGGQFKISTSFEKLVAVSGNNITIRNTIFNGSVTVVDSDNAVLSFIGATNSTTSRISFTSADPQTVTFQGASSTVLNNNLSLIEMLFPSSPGINTIKPVSNSHNVFIVNTTIPMSTINPGGASNIHNLQVDWYYDALVEDEDALPLSGATVSGSAATKTFSTTTDVFGEIPTQWLAEYVIENATVVQQNNWSIQASLTGYISENTSYAMNDLQVTDVFTLSESALIIIPGGGSLGPGGGRSILDPLNPNSPLYPEFNPKESFGEEVVVSDGNLTWKVYTDGHGNEYRLAIAPGGKRQKVIVYENLGNETVFVDVTCDGRLCEFLTVSNTELELIPEAGTYELNYIDIDFSEINNGLYRASLISTDQNGNEGVILITARAGIIGFFTEILLKLFGLKQIGDFKIPYVVFSLLLAVPVFFFSSFVLRKLNAGTAISVLIAGFSGIFLLLFI